MEAPQRTPNERVIIGGNSPPEPIDEFRIKYAEIKEAIKAIFDAGTPNTQDEADALEAFDRKISFVIKDAEAALKEECAPHNEAIKAFKQKYLVITDAFGRFRTALQPFRTEWLQKERERIDAERVAAQKAADEAALRAQEASKVAAAANASIDDLEKAAEIAAEADRVAKAAAAANKLKASAGAVKSANGTTKRTAYLKKTTEIEIADITAAVKFFSTKKNQLYHHLFNDALVRATKQYLKANPGAEIPGMKVTEVEKAI